MYLPHCSSSADQFQQVEDFYGGKRIPEDEFFENTLVRDFRIPRDRVSTFIEVFTENLRYLNLFDARRALSSGDTLSAEGIVTEPATVSAPVRSETRIREFLDTCFVMMPFGDWFDRYYKDIYVPAIKEAGFEPVRVDEMFSTGTVVEQIYGSKFEKQPCCSLTLLVAHMTPSPSIRPRAPIPL